MKPPPTTIAAHFLHARHSFSTPRPSSPFSSRRSPLFFLSSPSRSPSLFSHLACGTAKRKREREATSLYFGTLEFGATAVPLRVFGACCASIVRLLSTSTLTPTTRSLPTFFFVFFCLSPICRHGFSSPTPDPSYFQLETVSSFFGNYNALQRGQWTRSASFFRSFFSSITHVRLFIMSHKSLPYS